MGESDILDGHVILNIYKALSLRLIFGDLPKRLSPSRVLGRTTRCLLQEAFGRREPGRRCCDDTGTVALR